MSEARNQIFAALEAARPPAAPSPTRVAWPALPPDAADRFRDQVEAAGGQCQTLPRDGWAEQLVWPTAFESAAAVYSGCASISSRGIGLEAARVIAPGSPNASPGRDSSGGLDRPQALAPARLASLEICVIEGRFGVVENGAVWHVPRHPLERAAALLAEHLVLVLDESQLVASLHQAYDRIDLRTTAFGWFLCGPSKTADIEQSLVLGAHGPRTLTLALLGEAAPPRT